MNQQIRILTAEWNFHFSRKEALLDKVRLLWLTGQEVAEVDIEIARITALLKQIDAKRTYLVTGIEALPETRPKSLEWHFNIRKPEPVEHATVRNVVYVRFSNELMAAKDKSIERLAERCAYLQGLLELEIREHNALKRKSGKKVKMHRRRSKGAWLNNNAA